MEFESRGFSAAKNPAIAADSDRGRRPKDPEPAFKQSRCHSLRRSAAGRRMAWRRGTSGPAIDSDEARNPGQ